MSYFTKKNTETNTRLFDNVTNVKIRELIYDKERFIIENYVHCKTVNGSAIACFICDNRFFYANTVLENLINKAEQELGTKEAVIEEFKNSIAHFEEKKSKNGRNYYDIIFN